MGKFREKILSEKRKFKNTKDMGSDLGIAMQNAITNATDKWIKDNVNPIEGWPTPTARDETMLVAATHTMDFLKGMQRASKQSIARNK